MNLLRTFTLLAILAAVPATAAEPDRLSITFGSRPAESFPDIRQFALSPEVVFDSESRTLRLARICQHIRRSGQQFLSTVPIGRNCSAPQLWVRPAMKCELLPNASFRTFVSLACRSGTHRA